MRVEYRVQSSSNSSQVFMNQYTPYIEYTPYATERTHAANADPYYIAMIAGDEHGFPRKRKDSKVPIQARISGSPDRSNGPSV